jgi:hypothetical protein
MLDYFLIYLIIGVLLTWLTDYMNTNYGESQNKFDNIERAMLVVIWPYNLFLIVRAIVKALQ